MDNDIQTYRLTWQGISIETSYDPSGWGMIAHLQVKSIDPPRAPLPITETGYRSHFIPCGMVEELGGDVVAQVKAWLDDEARSPKWKAYLATSRQGDLFDL